MSVIMAPGWYDQIAPYVAQLSNIIPRLMNPHLDQQKMLMEQIARNPQIIQQFADLEANSPGITNKLGFGNISGHFASIPESAQSKLSKEKAQAVENLTPAQRQEYLANLVGVNTPQENQLFNLNVKNVETNIKKGEQDLAEGDQQRIENERIKGLETQFADWVRTRPGKTNLYALRRDNEVPDWVVDAITSSPKISKQYNQDAENYFREKGLILEKERIAAARAGTRQSMAEWQAKSLQDTAERYAYRAGSTNVEGFKLLIANPALESKFSQIPSDQLDAVAQQNPQLGAAIDAYKSQVQTNEKAKQGMYEDLRVAYQQARIAADRFRQGQSSELEVKSAIDNYNQRVGAARPAGINAGLLDWAPNPKATVGRMGPDFLVGKKQDDRPTLMTVDPKSGSKLPAGNSFELPKPNQSPEFKAQIDAAFKDLVRKSPVEREQILKDLSMKTDAASRAAYQELQSKFSTSSKSQATKPQKPDFMNKVTASEETTKAKPFQAPPKKQEPPKPKTMSDSLAGMPKGNLSSTQLAEHVTTYKAAKTKDEKDMYLREWAKELSPADLARIKIMLRIK